MKKLTLLTTACIIAVASAAQAVQAPSLGDQLKDNWDAKVDRNGISDPVKPGSDFLPNAVDNQAPVAQNNGWHHHMHNMSPAQKAAKKAEWDKMTPEQKAAKKSEMKAEHKEKMEKMTPEQKTKMKADRKAKWDAMTPAQKAAWKAKHDAKKAATTTSTPAPAAQ